MVSPECPPARLAARVPRNFSPADRSASFYGEKQGLSPYSLPPPPCPLPPPPCPRSLVAKQISSIGKRERDVPRTIRYSRTKRIASDAAGPDRKGPRYRRCTSASTHMHMHVQGVHREGVKKRRTSCGRSGARERDRTKFGHAGLLLESRGLS